MLVKSLRAGGKLDFVEHQECTRRADRETRKLRIEGEKALVAILLAAAPSHLHSSLEGRAVLVKLLRVGGKLDLVEHRSCRSRERRR